MSKRISNICMGAVILSAALCFTANLTPVTALAAAGAGPFAPAPAGSLLGLLRPAYITLATADHDYKGHRVKAMKAIEAACDLLGSDIRGEGKGHERQKISDDQLHQALSEVQQASAMVPAGKGQKKIVSHLDKAISELNIALSIK